MLKISFNNDPKTKEFILGLVGNSIDNDSFIIDKNGNRAIDSDGQEITMDTFSVIKKGSHIFVKENIVSLLDFYRKFIKK